MAGTAEDLVHVSVTPTHCFYAEIHTLTSGGSTNSTAWPTISLAMYVPFLMRVGATFLRAFSLNGTPSGNIDIGVYNENGTRLWSAGTTAMAGTGAPQTFTISPALYLPRGRYFLGLAIDNTTATIGRWTGTAGVGGMQKFLGVAQQASAFPLPATATFAAAVNNYIPMVGLCTAAIAL